MAKTKQDYFNMGYDDFVNNRPRKFSSNSSWQSQCYSSGWVAGSIEVASETEAQCIEIKYGVE